ncbi:MAG: hypothetical protein HY843_08845 [Bdellovibrio sp.]|nr:hypothetical protein [Bdellovibrio sp.]
MTVRCYLLVCTSFLLTACVSTRMSDYKIDSAFREGKYDDAIYHLQEGIKKEGESGRDLLLYLLDL